MKTVTRTAEKDYRHGAITTVAGEDFECPTDLVAHFEGVGVLKMDPDSPEAQRLEKRFKDEQESSQKESQRMQGNYDPKGSKKGSKKIPTHDNKTIQAGSNK